MPGMYRVLARKVMFFVFVLLRALRSDCLRSTHRYVINIWFLHAGIWADRANHHRISCENAIGVCLLFAVSKTLLAYYTYKHIVRETPHVILDEMLWYTHSRIHGEHKILNSSLRRISDSTYKYTQHNNISPRGLWQVPEHASSMEPSSNRFLCSTTLSPARRQGRGENPVLQFIPLQNSRPENMRR